MNLLKSFLISFSLFTTVTQSCNILSLSGGGVYGAFEIGIVSNLIEKKHTWDLITGVSAGALNTAYLSTIEPKYLQDHIQEFKTLWTSMTKKDIYTNDFFLNGLSLFDNTPYKKTLHKVFDSRVPKNNILISATSLHDGSSQIFDNEDILKYGYVDILLASTAIPIIFPPHEFLDDIFVDGGVTSNIVVNEAINYCIQNFPMEDIHIDAVITSKLRNIDVEIKMNILEILTRVVNILSEQFKLSELLHPIFEKDITVTVYEQKTLSNYSLLDFEHSEDLWNQGYTFENVNSFQLKQSKNLTMIDNDIIKEIQ